MHAGSCDKARYWRKNREPRRIRIVRLTHNKTLALMFNEKTPATKPTIKRRDGMKLREKARQQFVARDGIIAAKRHLYLTR